MSFTRRRYLTSMALLASAAACNPKSAQERQVNRVGVQLYTLRDEMAKDVRATLAAVAEAGYAEVETAGTGDLSPSEFAAALKTVGLTAPSAHVQPNLMADEPDTLLETAATIGYRYLVVPWMPPNLRTADEFKKVADLMNTFGEKSRAHGIQTGYHNHDFEFEAMDGSTPMQLLLERCDADLVKFELDLYWATHAGVDVSALLREHPGRFPLCHVKDRAANGDMMDVGDGEIDFPALFAAADGFEHYFVEHDRPDHSLQSVRRSITAVKAMRF